MSDECHGPLWTAPDSDVRKHSSPPTGGTARSERRDDARCWSVVEGLEGRPSARRPGTRAAGLLGPCRRGRPRSVAPCVRRSRCRSPGCSFPDLSVIWALLRPQSHPAG